MKKIFWILLFALILPSCCHYVVFYHAPDIEHFAGNDTELYIFIPVKKMKSLSYKVVDAPTGYSVGNEKIILITIDSVYNYRINEYKCPNPSNSVFFHHYFARPGFDDGKIYWMLLTVKGRRIDLTQDTITTYLFKDTALVECQMPNKELLNARNLDSRTWMHHDNLTKYHKEHGYYLYDAWSLEDIEWNKQKFKIETSETDSGFDIIISSKAMKQPIVIKYNDQLDRTPQKRYPWDD